MPDKHLTEVSVLDAFFGNGKVFAFGWVIFWLVASVIYRTSRNKPIFYKKPENFQFRQGNASGNSHKNWFTRIGGARNCLVVQVVNNQLDIHPMVPFNLLFLPEIYGLEFKIPLNQIKSAKLVKKLFSKMVELEFPSEEGNIEGISLLLKNPEDFLKAIGR